MAPGTNGAIEEHSHWDCPSTWSRLPPLYGMILSQAHAYLCLTTLKFIDCCSIGRIMLLSPAGCFLFLGCVLFSCAMLVFLSNFCFPAQRVASGWGIQWAISLSWSTMESASWGSILPLEKWTMEADLAQSHGLLGGCSWRPLLGNWGSSCQEDTQRLACFKLPRITYLDFFWPGDVLILQFLHALSVNHECDLAMKEVSHPLTLIEVLCK